MINEYASIINACSTESEVMSIVSGIDFTYWTGNDVGELNDIVENKIATFGGMVKRVTIKTSFSIQLHRDFYTNDATTQITCDILRDYAKEMYFTTDQSTLIAVFKTRRNMVECAAEIMSVVSNLSTGDIELIGR